MAGTVIKLRRSETSGVVPDNGSLALGEIAINIPDKKVWVGTGGNVAPPVLLVDYDAMIGGGGASGTFTYSSTAPGSPSHGDTWFKSDTGDYYIYIDDGDSSQWVELTGGGSGGGGGGSGNLTYSSTEPVSPVHGDSWFKSDTGDYYIYINDGDSSQWVEIGGGGGSGSNYTVSSTAPTGASAGDLWYHSTEHAILMYINDGDSFQWVEI